VIGSFACKGLDTFGIMKLIGGVAKGRPNEKDLQEARIFAKGLLK
jgi:flavodoxin